MIVIKRTSCCANNLLQIVLEENLGYSLSEFFLISKSSKNDLLKALNSLNSESSKAEEEIEIKSHESIDQHRHEAKLNNFGCFYPQEPQNISPVKFFSKEMTPIRMRNSSINSVNENREARICSTK